MYSLSRQSSVAQQKYNLDQLEELEHWGHPGHLDEKQQKCLQQMRARVSSDELEHIKFQVESEDSALCRYLRARKFDVDAAYEMVKNCRKRRLADDVARCVADGPSGCLRCPAREVKTFYPEWYLGLDRRGRPVLVSGAGRLDMAAVDCLVATEDLHRWHWCNLESREAYFAEALAAHRGAAAAAPPLPAPAAAAPTLTRAATAPPAAMAGSPAASPGAAAAGRAGKKGPRSLRSFRRARSRSPWVCGGRRGAVDDGWGEEVPPAPPAAEGGGEAAEAEAPPTPRPPSPPRKETASAAGGLDTSALSGLSIDDHVDKEEDGSGPPALRLQLVPPGSRPRGRGGAPQRRMSGVARGGGVLGLFGCSPDRIERTPSAPPGGGVFFCGCSPAMASPGGAPPLPLEERGRRTAARGRPTGPFDAQGGRLSPADTGAAQGPPGGGGGGGGRPPAPGRASSEGAAPSATLGPPPPPIQVVVITDLAGMTTSTMTKKVYQFISHATKLGSDCYPELMGKAFIINAPLFFVGVWRVLQGWMDPRTVSKISIERGVPTEKLLEVVPAEVLPAEWGGLARGRLAAASAAHCARLGRAGAHAETVEVKAGAGPRGMRVSTNHGGIAATVTFVPAAGGKAKVISSSFSEVSLEAPIYRHEEIWTQPGIYTIKWKNTSKLHTKAIVFTVFEPGSENTQISL